MYDSETKTEQIDLFSPGEIPAKESTLTVLSCGLGQDSTAILYKMVYDKEFRKRYGSQRLLCLFADTGDEHPTTYDHLEYLKKFCLDNDIEFVAITPDMGFHGRGWSDLRTQYRLHSTCGSKGFVKSCTDRLKIGPIYRYLEDWINREYKIPGRHKQAIKKFAQQYGIIKMIVGIAEGEQGRIKKTESRELWHRVAIETIYPLVDLKMDRQACQDYIRSTGHPVPSPSNCICCPFISLQELLWLERFLPEDLADWQEIERIKLEKHAYNGDITKTKTQKGEIKNNQGVWPTRNKDKGVRTLEMVIEEAREKYGHWSDEDLEFYKQSHGHCVQSAY